MELLVGRGRACRLLNGGEGHAHIRRRKRSNSGVGSRRGKMPAMEEEHGCGVALWMLGLGSAMGAQGYAYTQRRRWRSRLELRGGDARAGYRGGLGVKGRGDLARVNGGRWTRSWGATWSSGVARGRGARQRLRQRGGEAPMDGRVQGGRLGHGRRWMVISIGVWGEKRDIVSE